MEKHAENGKNTQPLQQKRLGEVKNVQHLNVLIHSTIVKAQILAYIFQVSLIPLSLVNRQFS